MSRLFALLCAVVVGASLSGCGTSAARTNSFVSNADVTALMGLPNGGLRYGTGGGKVYEVDKDGKRVGEATSAVLGESILGLVADQKDRTFASWRDTATGDLTIAQVLPGPTRIVFRSDAAMTTGTAARLAVSHENRLIVTYSPRNAPSQVLSVDPDRNDDQKANVLSTNWKSLGGVAYAAGSVMWVVDGGGENRIARTGPDGPSGTVNKTGKDETPIAMSSYGDTELVVCFAKSGTLQRFSISDGIQALAGRDLAHDCSGDITELHDGRIAYVTKTEIRVTAL